MEQGILDKLFDIFLNNLISSQKPVKMILKTGAVIEGSIINLFGEDEVLGTEKRITVFNQPNGLILNAELDNIEEIIVPD